MDDTQALECTQALPDDWDDESAAANEPKLAAWLEINGTKHEIFEGQTKIGRDPATCKIVLPNKVLSKEHADFDVDADSHTIADLGSTNRTRIGKMILKPNVRYILHGGEELKFGDLPAKYIIKPKTLDIDDSGSETGSESMLLDDTEELPGSPILSHKLPGLDITKASEGAADTTNASNLSDFITTSPASNLLPQKTYSFVPESPSTSQSTPKPQSRCKAVPESPGNVSTIQNTTGGDETDDSFFFDPSQPPKNKSPQANKNDSLKMVHTSQVTEKPKTEDYLSDESTDVEDDIPEQIRQRSSGKSVSKDEKASPKKDLDASMRNDVLDRSNKKAENDTEKVEGDIFNDATQAFTSPADVPRVTAIMGKAAESPSVAPKDADNTQDILDAFGIESNEGEGDDDLPPTQVFERSPAALNSRKPEDDDYVPTQLFMDDDDDDDDDLFKKPLPPLISKTPKRYLGLAKKAGIGKDRLHVTNDSVLGVATQLYDDMMPTQKYEPEPGTSKAEHEKDDDDDIFNEATQQFSADEHVSLGVPARISCPKGGSKNPVQECDNDDSEIDSVFNQPTQVFTSDTDTDSGYSSRHKNDDVDDDDLPPTQIFTAPSPVSSMPPSHKKSSPGIRTIQEKRFDDTDDDVATQLFDDDFDAPTQPFISDRNNIQEDMNAPTQPFVADNDKTLNDFDMPTQPYVDAQNKAKDKHGDTRQPPKEDAYSGKTDFDDAPTIPFVDYPDKSEEEDLPPTQMYVDDRKKAESGKSKKKLMDDEDFDAPTQIYTEDDQKGDEDQPSRKQMRIEDIDAPTQIYTDDNDKVMGGNKSPKKPAEDNDDCDAPTQVYTEDNDKKMADNQRSKKPAENNDDFDAPTQVYTDDNDKVADNQPSKKPRENNDDFDAPTQVYTEDNDKKMADNQRSKKPAENNDDFDAPTQVYTEDDDKKMADNQPSKKPRENNDDFDAPTQVYTEDNDKKMADNQLSKKPAENNDDFDAPTQVYTEDDDKKMADNQPSKKPAEANDDFDAPTQVYTEEGTKATEKDPPRGISEAWDNLDADATQDFSLDTIITIDKSRSVAAQSVSKSGDKDKDKNKSRSLTPATIRAQDSEDEDDRSSTASENMLDGLECEDSHLVQEKMQEDKKETEKIDEEEDYNSDVSTDIEDEISSPKGNNSRTAQSSDMSRLELSSDSDATSVRKPGNAHALKWLKAADTAGLEAEDRSETSIDNKVLKRAPSQTVAQRKLSLNFVKISKKGTFHLSASTPVPETRLSQSQSTMDSCNLVDMSLTDLKFQDSEDNDTQMSSVSEESPEKSDIKFENSEDGEKCKTPISMPSSEKKIREVDLYSPSDSDSDSEGFTISQPLFVISPKRPHNRLATTSRKSIVAEVFNPEGESLIDKKEAVEKSKLSNETVSRCNSTMMAEAENELQKIQDDEKGSSHGYRTANKECSIDKQGEMVIGDSAGAQSTVVTEMVTVKQNKRTGGSSSETDESALTTPNKRGKMMQTAMIEEEDSGKIKNSARKRKGDKESPVRSGEESDTFSGFSGSPSKKQRSETLEKLKGAVQSAVEEEDNLTTMNEETEKNKKEMERQKVGKVEGEKKEVEKVEDREKVDIEEVVNVASDVKEGSAEVIEDAVEVEKLESRTSLGRGQRSKGNKNDNGSSSSSLKSTKQEKNIDKRKRNNRNDKDEAKESDVIVKKSRQDCPESSGFPEEVTLSDVQTVGRRGRRQNSNASTLSNSSAISSSTSSSASFQRTTRRKTVNLPSRASPARRGRRRKASDASHDADDDDYDTPDLEIGITGKESRASKMDSNDVSGSVSRRETRTKKNSSVRGNQRSDVNQEEIKVETSYKNKKKDTVTKENAKVEVDSGIAETSEKHDDSTSSQPEVTATIRTKLGRTRREPKRYSPDRDIRNVPSPKDSSTRSLGRGRKSAAKSSDSQKADEEMELHSQAKKDGESKAFSSKNQDDIKQSSHRGRRKTEIKSEVSSKRKKDEDTESMQASDDSDKQEQGATQRSSRRLRASIATSEPAKVKTATVKQPRLSVIPEKSTESIVAETTKGKKKESKANKKVAEPLGKGNDDVPTDDLKSSPDENDEQEQESVPQRSSRRGRTSIATSRPTSKETKAPKQSRFSMFPEQTGEEVIKSRRNNKKESIGKDLTNEKDSDMKKATAEVKTKEKDSDMKKATAEVNKQVLSQGETSRRGRQVRGGPSNENSDGEQRLKRSSSHSSQESDDTQERKRKRGSKEVQDDLPSTPKSARSRVPDSKGSPHVKDAVLWSPSRRQQQASLRPRVLFTGYKDAQDEKIVTELGGLVVDSPHVCSVLVTTNIRRTCKLLAVMGRGLPIVTPGWLSASKQARNFVDPWEYLVKDTEAEKKYGFRLEQSLRSASKSMLFEGLTIHATTSVKPPPDQMKDIIECSGGEYLDMAPRRAAPQIRVVSCPEDKSQWALFKRLKIPVLGTEFILTGLLRHQLLLDDFLLQ